MSFGEQRVHDPIAARIGRYAQNVLILIFGLLPLIFYPSPLVAFENTKILVALGGLLVALILFSLSVLRSGKITFGFSYSFVAIWVVALAVFISALLSGDLRDAMYGDLFSTHSAAFVGLLALTATMWMLVGMDKAVVMRLYILLAASTLILALFHVVRLALGADVFVFGVFNDSAATPIGGWNDLAIYMGLTVLLSLLTLEQLPLTRSGKILFAIVILVALGMLSIINFVYVWYVLGLVSLVMLVYTLGRDRLSGGNSNQLIRSKIMISGSLGYSLIVFAVSILFIIGGSALGGFISKYTGISYVEVRPSFTATIDIAREVYKENAFVGIGANKFADAWRLYKDSGINSTVFWNTDFNAGNGYIPTFLVTTGVIGALAWIAFLVLFLTTGIKMLTKASDNDRMWYFIGTSAFVGAVYIWVMSVVYVPGAVMLLLGAMCTGLTFIAGSALMPTQVKNFSLGTNRRMGFVITLIVIAVIVGSVNVLYAASRHYGAVYTFNAAGNELQKGSSLEEVQAEIARAYEMSNSDIFARQVAEYYIGRVNEMLAIQREPTKEEQARFEDALVNGVNAGKLATETDGGDPANWAVLGTMYSVLVTANIEGAYEEAKSALTKAKDLDPVNPLRYLMLAELEARSNNADAARQFAQEAIRLKPNFGEAYFFLSQIDIAAGNTEGAVKSTQAIIELDPRNPSRYYQLGVLQSAGGMAKEAILSFERAVELDSNYANARYFLALGYDALGRSQDAKMQLQKVLELNPGNEDVINLIATIDRTGSLAELRNQTETTEQLIPNEQQATQLEDGTVTTDKELESDVVTPVNNIPAEVVGEATTEAPNMQE